MEERRRVLRERSRQELAAAIEEILEGMTFTAGLTDAQRQPTDAGRQFLASVQDESQAAQHRHQVFLQVVEEFGVGAVRKMLHLAHGADAEGDRGVSLANNDDGLTTVALSVTADSVSFTHAEDTDCGTHSIPLDEATRILDTIGQ